MARELKNISFNKSNRKDMELLNHVDSLGVSFGSYVKLLIRKDMEKELPVKKEVKNKLENQVNSKESINSIENKLDYIIDKINEQDDIQITIKR